MVGEGGIYVGAGSSHLRIANAKSCAWADLYFGALKDRSNSLIMRSGSVTVTEIISRRYHATKACAYPNDNEHNHDHYKHQHPPLEPQLAVFEVEAHFGQIPHEIGLPRQLLADNSTHRRAECGIRAKNREECAKREVCNGVIPVKPDEGWDTLSLGG
jgi:hypothetical protein